MSAYASIWVLMGPYRSLCVLMNLDGSSFVLICPYRSLSVLMRVNGSL